MNSPLTREQKERIARNKENAVCIRNQRIAEEMEAKEMEAKVCLPHPRARFPLPAPCSEVGERR